VELRIVDLEGADAAPGEVGELWVSGPNVMKGYYRDWRATALALRDGWLATGDLARIAPDGSVHIEGRLKELIIRSGFNVYPVEVEAVSTPIPRSRNRRSWGATWRATRRWSPTWSWSRARGPTRRRSRNSPPRPSRPTSARPR
jgi:acyl-CoA synthetase (AMP-forming)/AMP-acid ligase II